MNSFYPRYALIVSQILMVFTYAYSQNETEIIDYNLNEKGQVQLTVNSSSDKYYILKVRHSPTESYDLSSSMTLGEDNQTTITEALSAYPIEHYQILEFERKKAVDTDNDGVDDITEYEARPLSSPLNAAEPVSLDDGAVWLSDFTTFKELSITNEVVQWSEFLNGKVFVKYIIVDFWTERPRTYFINSSKHNLHEDFAKKIGIDYLGDQVKKGQVIYHPNAVSNNGSLGTFAFNYSNGKGQDFEVVQRTQELLSANMQFIENNLSHYITENNEDEYARDKTLYEGSRVPVLFESDVYTDVPYWGFHLAEGYGFLRHMSLGEIPSSRDIVLYDDLPNSLPRVSGIITSVFQTPLSHVNLRAIQNEIPNAYIKDPLSIDSIAALLDRNVYFKVEQGKYTLREATQDEVNEWFDNIRPKEEQVPLLNLDYRAILDLDDISFEMNDGFGAKCTNVAEMRNFGFVDPTIPDGYGVPFYYYQEFMKHNGFFESARNMIGQADFQADRSIRESRLKKFRKEIRAGEMPTWMLDELNAMHRSFPENTSLRCRSSTNNEDLPGFNGAGLYTSKTHHPDEGHIQKTIQQVFAGIWNLRAFEERDFYRVDHFKASMAVLCHPNYEDEKANGVAISRDPLYNTDNSFYLNSQVGELLITNPDNNSIPEEILLDRVPVSENDYIVIQRSNLLPSDSIIMNENYLDLMREHLSVIHDRFAVLYKAEDNPAFAMDIEYKITADDHLIIKQARPWVSFVPEDQENPAHSSSNKLVVWPNPTRDLTFIKCQDCRLAKLNIHDTAGRLLMSFGLDSKDDTKVQVNLDHLPTGLYIINGLTEDDVVMYNAKVLKR